MLKLSATALRMAKFRILLLPEEINSNEQYQDAWNRLSYTLSIRIPSDRFEAFVKGVEEGEGRIVSKQITARDVTEEYLDLELRQRSEEHTSELQSRPHLVCRLLLEKKNTK